jgi:hypothetical protein
MDLETAPLDRVRAALDAGDLDAARVAVERWATAVRSLQVFSHEWITSLLSFVGRELGDDGVERSLRAFGDEYVLPRRDPVAWEQLPVAVRAGVIAKAMLTNGGSVQASADDEGITLAFRCGSGGRLVDEGRYDVDGGPYLTLQGPSPLTFGRPSLPVYCAHCPVHNELLELERGSVPTSVEEPTTGPGGVCVHRVPADPRALDPWVWTRVGLEAPDAR